MTSEIKSYHADVVIIGFGAAGSCAAIEAHGAGASVVLLEKQPEATHYSNTRMSGDLESLLRHGARHRFPG